MTGDNTDFKILRGKLTAWNRRRKLRDALLWAPRLLLAGLLLAVIIAALARFRPLLDNEELTYFVAVCALSGLSIGLLAALGRPFSLIQQAHFADRRFRLQERAATAVEIHAGLLEIPGFLREQQLSDAAQAAAAVDTRAGLPLRPAWRDWALIIVASGLLLLAIALPNPQADILRHQRAVAAAVEEQADALQALVEEINENPALNQGQREALLEPLAGALEALDDGSLSQEQAVAVLSEAEADLRALSENTATELLESLGSAGQPLADNANAGQLGSALQNGNLSAAGSAAAQLADSLPELTAAEQAALAADLAETAAALAQVDSELAQQFAEAAQALQNGDIAAAQQALREAGGALQQRAQEAAAAQQAAAAAGQLQSGRDAVAQAGQGEAQGAGQQAGSQGQGQSSSGEGTGGESEGEGVGTGSTGSSGEGGLGDSSGGIGGETGHAESVFVPDFVDLESAAGEQIELPAECFTNPELCGGLLSENPTAFGDETSRIPYEQVFGDYRNAAYEALSEDYIPLGLKGFIRDYFASLEPR